MDKYFIIVAGTGQSSRANIEALLEDYVYGNGQDVVFVLSYDTKPSQGQIFVSQFAKDKNKDIIIVANENANYEGIASASVFLSDDPNKKLTEFCKGKKAVAFLLTDDEDLGTNDLVGTFVNNGIPAFDLCEGLMPLKYSEVEKAVEFPEAETIEDEDDLEEPEDPEDEYEDSLDELEEDELADEVYFGIQALVKLIAREVVNELANRSETDKKAPRK